MRFINEAVETFERAEDWINPTVISDIITEVTHWRGIDRRNPDRIDAEPDKIIEPLPDTIKIAYAITVRVLKGPGVDLIDCPDLPPFMRHDATREATKAGATIRDGAPERALSQELFLQSLWMFIRSTSGTLKLCNLSFPVRTNRQTNGKLQLAAVSRPRNRHRACFTS
jgi:hypothetical protein